MIYFLQWVPLLSKFQWLQFPINLKSFCLRKGLKILEWTLLFNFKRPFCMWNVGHSFSHIHVDIKKSNMNWNFQFSICIKYWHINFKRVFGPKKYEIWRCSFNKNFPLQCNKEHGCIIFMIYDKNLQSFVLITYSL